MKALLVSLLAVPALAFANDAQLRSECASKNKVSAKPGEHTFVYHQGKLRGEAKPGKQLACTEGQFNTYVASVDPARLMAMNPTAAGRSTEEHVFSYKKGKLAPQ